SSIDLSNAYNGVAGYNVLAVGILVFVSNWAGPIWWAVGAMVLLVGQQPGTDEEFKKGGQKRRAWVEAERELLAANASPEAQTAMKTGTMKQTPKDILKDSYLAYFSTSTLFISGSLLAVQVACKMLRTHLFIWTVFSPKYLYS